MSEWLAAAFLGAVQGLTEFLPVSSSGHLVLFQEFLPISGDEVLFDLVLHLGTLIPVLAFYRQDLALILRDLRPGPGLWQRPGAQLAAAVVVATAPTAAIGLAFKDVFEALFANPAALVFSFALTGLLLHSTTVARPPHRTLSLPLALILGIAQGIAITPGISRSGTTIAVALLLGLEREQAARFSFLMSLPAILGAVLLKLRDVEGYPSSWGPLLLGALVAVVVGALALQLLVRLVLRGQFAAFRWYVWGMALVAAGVAWIR
jgi:undecaprenyl-diphosphatase